ncbi:MAG: hypothetical protein CSA23_00025 [Deltaproteobacteria bacterium]|nr:MAG: hypothetical protein CSA23_00025 [Deltaproteobacteria bacterium]
MDPTWQSLKGQFLMAMPGLTDPNFYQSVTCLAEHNQNGAMGIIVSRIYTNLSARIIFDELKISSTPAAKTIPIHVGGPVHTNELFVLHTAPFEWDGCMMINEGLALSHSPDILEAIAIERGPRFYLMALGCAGWGPGQLESEIRGNAWINGPYSQEVAFNVAVEHRWRICLENIGIDPALLSDTAGHA